MEILTNKISDLESQQPSLAGATLTPDTITDNTSTGTTLKDGSIKFDASVTAVNLVALAQLESKGSLVVEGNSEFRGKVLLKLLAQFNGPVEFKDIVNFDKTITQNSDAGGTAVIKKGVKKVSVSFNKEYAQTPIVVASWSFADTKDQTGKMIDSSEDKHQRLLDANFNYLLSNVTTKGFDIIINKNATEGLNLSWLATLVKDAKITTSIQ